MRNRLKLDWTIESAKDRNSFVTKYIQSDVFKKRSPTEDELEMIGNYVLWGKNEDNLNIEQEKLVQLPRRNTTWAARNVESLDELLESPVFDENSIYPLSSKAPTKKVREVFSREEARKNAPKDLLFRLEKLWRTIDKTDLLINFYDLRKGKRKNEPRASLLSVFTQEEQDQIKQESEELTQFKYFKMRHLLVELRREQYTIRDSYQPQISTRNFSEAPSLDRAPVFDSDIPVYPLGLVCEAEISCLLFQSFSNLIPENFTEEEVLLILPHYWSKQTDKQNSQQTNTKYIDLTDLETVYQLILQLEFLEEVEESLYSTTSNLLKTLNYYTKEADLTEVQREILNLKIAKVRNQDIARVINSSYNKTYTDNYISTIFRQKIIPAINQAARYHAKLIELLPFEEEFKKCTKCGKTLLRDPVNFVRKSRAKDGLSNHCKVCDKKSREDKKEK